MILLRLFLIITLPLSIMAEEVSFNKQHIKQYINEMPYDFEQMSKDALNIQAYEESKITDFDIDFSKDHIYEFVAWNIADIYTTTRAIETNVGREMNPILPSHPHLDRLIIHKVLASYLFYNANYFDNTELIKATNKVGWLIVVNNAYVLYD